ncbi:MAG: hypothetical protein K9H64_04575 [Bacteroidales bacterium]|nr:hypothetical protein [Bacteroidales bacterium]MCF8455121.1 hypothetical protein [Bacteroidales bacterium]
MYKTIICILLLGLLLSKARSLHGQEDRVRFIGVESGIDFQICESTEYDFIRGDVDVSMYGLNDGANNLTLSLQNWYIGTKAEIRTKNNRFGLSTGVRFSQITSSMSKSTGWSGTADFFYILNKQEGTSTEYLRVKEINQVSNYLGIPVEIKFYPTKPYFVRFFIKGAALISGRLNTSNNVVFYSDEMNPYQNDVINKFDEPKFFLGMVHGSVGIKFGHEDNINLSLEAATPSIIFTENSSSLLKPMFGGGLQLNILIPF